MHRFEKINNLSINIFELKFYLDENKWKLSLIPIEISKIESDRVVDRLIYKKHYALIKKLNLSLGDHHKNLMCRRCLNSYTSEIMLMIHEPKCESIDITTIRVSSESHPHSEDHFHKKTLYFRKYADFAADKKTYNSSTGNKTTNIYKQIPILNGYHTESELEDVLKSGYFKSPLVYNIVDWFINEVIYLENKMVF